MFVGCLSPNWKFICLPGCVYIYAHMTLILWSIHDLYPPTCFVVGSEISYILRDFLNTFIAFINFLCRHNNSANMGRPFSFLNLCNFSRPLYFPIFVFSCSSLPSWFDSPHSCLFRLHSPSLWVWNSATRIFGIFAFFFFSSPNLVFILVYSSFILDYLSFVNVCSYWINIFLFLGLFDGIFNLKIFHWVKISFSETCSCIFLSFLQFYMPNIFLILFTQPWIKQGICRPGVYQ